ncbi:MAG TPA: hypothetical protein VGL19_12575 [Polyangiaceae bacterium]|jgi:hypothetical protein
MSALWNGKWSAAPTSLDRRALHSWPYFVLSRYFVLAPAALMSRMGYHAALEQGVLALGPFVFPALLLVLIALVIRGSTPRVYATPAGLEISHGLFKSRLVPWPNVSAIRELPWLRQSTPWQPKMWQVDFERGSSISFIGSRRAAEIVARFKCAACGGPLSSVTAHPAS